MNISQSANPKQIKTASELFNTNGNATKAPLKLHEMSTDEFLQSSLKIYKLQILLQNFNFI